MDADLVGVVLFGSILAASLVWGMGQVLLDALKWVKRRDAIRKDAKRRFVRMRKV